MKTNFIKRNLCVEFRDGQHRKLELKLPPRLKCIAALPYHVILLRVQLYDFLFIFISYTMFCLTFGSSVCYL